MIKKDLTNKRFGKLTVLRENGKKNKSIYWECLCDCGVKKTIKGSHLTTNKITSCGCIQRMQRIKNVSNNVTHNKSKTKLYHTWSGMKRRCLNESCDNYKIYGARGISVCNEWLNFETFYEWAVNNGYDENKKLSIDRINNNGDYEPNNCRWVDKKTQNRNRRTSKNIKYKNETKTLGEWCEIYNKKYYLVWQRINRGVCFEKAMEIKRS